MLHRPKHRRTPLSNFACIALHNTQIRAYSLRQIDLVNNQQITARDPGATLSRHFISTGDVNNVNDEIG